MTLRLAKGMREHERAGALRAALVNLYKDRRWVEIDGVVFRAVKPAYASLEDLLSGAGSRVHGSRWIAPGTLAVLHAAGTPEGAVREALAQYRRYGVKLPDALHLVLRGVRLRLRRVLDLRDRDVCGALGVSLEDLRNVEWERANREHAEALTQAIGRLSAAVGFSGLRVPSAADRSGTNVVVFVTRLGEGESAAVPDAP
ncbi:MAG: RES family NAD+ phosphorylase [Phycisphaerales bacterium]|jgi:RES domain-containing protein|nr:RES family NAD+ phosphorylase [Phycisphaeraceae bacterium]